jgi:hypothetical protein
VICGAAAQGYAWVAAADAACSGEACSLVAVAADGCSFKNTGDKSVRFSLVAGGAARVVTVLGPGETFKEANKAFCVAGDAGDKRLEASFAVLGKAPTDDRDFTLKGTAKPSIAKPAVATPAVAATDAVQVASTTPAIPMPRAKPAAPPAYPPAPRAKPEVVEVAMAAPPAPAPVAAPAAPVPVAPPAAIQPTTAAEAEAKMPTAACGEACPPILFKVIDNCLWVMNLNPRAVAFEADIGGKHTKLALEAADGDKADAHAAVAEVKDLGALHMRLKDPFQSAGSGIPVYRARLGSPSSCVKSRAEITTFSASYVK